MGFRACCYGRLRPVREASNPATVAARPRFVCGFGSSGVGPSGVTVTETELQDCPLYLPSPEVIQESSKGL